MTKKIMFMALAGAMLMSSCNAGKGLVSEKDLRGEWNIVEVKGNAITQDQHPFIGFNTDDNRIYGNSGCNRVMGSFDLSAESNKITLGNMASTMMACPNMDLEQNVLRALGEVSSINRAGSNNIALCNANKELVMLLEKRFTEIPLAKLEGEWHIISVYGSRIKSTSQNVPSIIFDTNAQKISGNASCNRMMGSFRTDAGLSNSISFAGIALTRMACPDMQLENNIVSALESVKTFGLLPSGNVALFNVSGDIVVELLPVK